MLWGVFGNSHLYAMANDARLNSELGADSQPIDSENNRIRLTGRLGLCPNASVIALRLLSFKRSNSMFQFEDEMSHNSPGAASLCNWFARNGPEIPRGMIDYDDGVEREIRPGARGVL